MVNAKTIVVKSKSSADISGKKLERGKSKTKLKNKKSIRRNGVSDTLSEGLSFSRKLKSSNGNNNNNSVSAQETECSDVRVLVGDPGNPPASDASHGCSSGSETQVKATVKGDSSEKIDGAKRTRDPQRQKSKRKKLKKSNSLQATTENGGSASTSNGTADHSTPAEKMETTVDADDSDCESYDTKEEKHCCVVKQIDLDTCAETVDVTPPADAAPAPVPSARVLGRNSRRSSFFVGGCDQSQEDKGQVSVKSEDDGASGAEDVGEDVLMHGRRRWTQRQEMRASARGGRSRGGRWRGAERRGRFSARGCQGQEECAPAKEPSQSAPDTDGSTMLNPSYLTTAPRGGHGEQPRDGNRSNSGRFRSAGRFAGRRGSHGGRFNKNDSQEDLHPSWKAKRNQRSVDFSQKSNKIVFD